MGQGLAQRVKHPPPRGPGPPRPAPVCLPPGDGWLHRAVVVGSSVHIIEELQVFKDPQPVENLVISQAQVRGGPGGQEQS